MWINELSCPGTRDDDGGAQRRRHTTVVRRPASDGWPLIVMLLGLGSALCWGTADFFGGLQSRRLPSLAVALWSQIAGGLVLLGVLLLSGRTPVLAGLLWGVLAGMCSGTGLALFYRGLAVGMMSIVAPISACSALVPVVFSLATGHAPSVFALIGIAAAIAGIVLVSRQAVPGEEDTRDQHRTLLLALGSALGFGLFYVLVERGSSVPGVTPLWVIGGARIGSLAMLLAIAGLGRRGTPWPGRRAVPVAAVGVLDTTANALYAYASLQGNLGVVSVLASLYPVTTVLLGRVILSERLASVQHAGVVLALAGVALLSAG